MVEDAPGANTLLNDAQRWGLVIDVQDALEGLTEMLETLAENEMPIPTSSVAILRVLGSALDTPIGICLCGK